MEAKDQNPPDPDLNALLGGLLLGSVCAIANIGEPRLKKWLREGLLPPVKETYGERRWRVFQTEDSTRVIWMAALVRAGHIRPSAAAAFVRTPGWEELDVPVHFSFDPARAEAVYRYVSECIERARRLYLLKRKALAMQNVERNTRISIGKSGGVASITIAGLKLAICSCLTNKAIVAELSPEDALRIVADMDKIARAGEFPSTNTITEFETVPDDVFVAVKAPACVLISAGSRGAIVATCNRETFSAIRDDLAAAAEASRTTLYEAVETGAFIQ